MIFNCQRKPAETYPIPYYTHQVEAPDEGTARVMMFNRSFSWSWLDPNKTDVWPAEEWIAT
jgi:hypothetical protein